MTIKLADGRKLDLFGVGQRIKDRNGLIGTIANIEMCRPGVPSAIPYRVSWDDETQARKMRGLLFIYADHKGLTALESKNEDPHS